VFAICRVYAHQNGADLSGRVLCQNPLRAVGRPDSDPVPWLDAFGKQSARKDVNVGIQFGIGPTSALIYGDQCVATGKGPRDSIQILPDGFTEQGHLAAATCIR
jgi:hypothetical protein